MGRHSENGMREAISRERQQARCAFTVLAMGHAILALPDELPIKIGAKKMANCTGRLTRWLDKACEEVGANRLPPFNGRTVAALLGKFRKLAFPADYGLRHCVAAFWAANVFLWDVRASCPDAARGQTWRWLALASEEFARILLLCCEDAAMDGDTIYMELVW